MPHQTDRAQTEGQQRAARAIRSHLLLQLEIIGGRIQVIIEIVAGPGVVRLVDHDQVEVEYRARHLKGHITLRPALNAFVSAALRQRPSPLPRCAAASLASKTHVHGA